MFLERMYYLVRILQFNIIIGSEFNDFFSLVINLCALLLTHCCVRKCSCYQQQQRRPKLKFGKFTSIGLDLNHVHSSSNPITEHSEDHPVNTLVGLTLNSHNGRSVECSPINK